MPGNIKIDDELREVLLYGDPSEVGFRVVQEGDWVNEYKDYDHKEIIFEELSTGNFYAYYQSRSGSYYTDYEYDNSTELVEVVKKEVVVIKYVEIK